ncbi:MAG TPA: hypothetical protein VK850_17015, partial [Candidatus Binatia bacterium]|nr:hypothetical protein [Candidatus Binatia bacterium]
MIKLVHLLRRRRDTVAAPFVPALERVREMRDDARWEPLCGANQIQKQADRVSQIREQVTIPHLATERQRVAPRMGFRVWLDLFG